MYVYIYFFFYTMLKKKSNKKKKKMEGDLTIFYSQHKEPEFNIFILQLFNFRAYIIELVVFFAFLLVFIDHILSCFILTK